MRKSSMKIEKEKTCKQFAKVSWKKWEHEKKFASRPGRSLVLTVFNMKYSILDYEGSMVTFVMDIPIVLVIFGVDHSMSTSYNIQPPMSSESSSQ